MEHFLSFLTWIEWDTKYYGVKLYDSDFMELFIRFSFNLLVAFIIIYYNYYKHHKKSQYTFTFFIFNILIFFISYMMASVKLELGFAFGLFAIFSILRYRTDPLPIKEMTYLFIVITVAVINAITTKKVSYFELFFTNFIIVFSSYLIERIWYNKELQKINIEYPVFENLHVNQHKNILRELQSSTGLDIHHFEINSIDYSKKTMKIKIHYKP
ncbi:MAG: DUF4956 domain-containing protein [Cyclobacteriaceae bacterium]|nr:DUF4956 domain-containing protein [Cyclobacteriaceae bacterium]